MVESSRQNPLTSDPKQNIVASAAVGLNSTEREIPGVLYCQHILADGRAKYFILAGISSFLLSSNNSQGARCLITIILIHALRYLNHTIIKGRKQFSQNFVFEDLQ